MKYYKKKCWLNSKPKISQKGDLLQIPSKQKQGSIRCHPHLLNPFKNYSCRTIQKGIIQSNQRRKNLPNKASKGIKDFSVHVPHLHHHVCVMHWLQRPIDLEWERIKENIKISIEFGIQKGNLSIFCQNFWHFTNKTPETSSF